MPQCHVFFVGAYHTVIMLARYARLHLSVNSNRHYVPYAPAGCSSCCGSRTSRGVHECPHHRSDLSKLSTICTSKTTGSDFLSADLRSLYCVALVITLGLRPVRALPRIPLSSSRAPRLGRSPGVASRWLRQPDPAPTHKDSAPAPMGHRTVDPRDRRRSNGYGAVAVARTRRTKSQVASDRMPSS